MTGGGGTGGSGGDTGSGTGGTPLMVSLTGPSHTASVSVELEFGCSDAAGCTYTCSVDDSTAEVCTSPHPVAVPEERSYHVVVVATDPAGSTAQATHTIVVDRTAPELIDLEFTEYDELTLSFSEEIDPSSLDPSDFSITERPQDLAVHSVTAEDHLVRVRLTRLHLPWNGYLLSFVVRDLAGNDLGVTDESLTPALHSRLAFATEATVDGSIPLPDGVGCAASTGVGRADCICQHEANEAGMLGAFRAVLSDDANDAYCRMRGLDGEAADDCGLGEEETLPPLGPWVRADGIAVSSRESDEDVRGLFMTSPRFTAAGAASSLGVWTGTATGITGDLTADSHCSSWESTSGTGTHTYPLDQRLPLWWDLGSGCGNSFGLLCVQVDSGGLTTRPIAGVPEGARRVFVSSVTTNGNVTFAGSSPGLAAADALCTSLAAAADLPGAGYVALLSDSGNDAFCRLLGLSGERGADDCGASSTEIGDRGPFVSVFGHTLADDALELFSTGVRDNYGGNESGGRQFISARWTGTEADGTASTNVCGDWQQPEGSSTLGQAYGVGTNFVNSGGNSCSVAASLVCVQQ